MGTILIDRLIGLFSSPGTRLPESKLLKTCNYNNNNNNNNNNNTNNNNHILLVY
jgi:hypothetical protein